MRIFALLPFLRTSLIMTLMAGLAGCVVAPKTAETILAKVTEGRNLRNLSLLDVSDEIAGPLVTMSVIKYRHEVGQDREGFGLTWQIDYIYVLEGPSGRIEYTTDIGTARRRAGEMTDTFFSGDGEGEH